MGITKNKDHLIYQDDGFTGDNLEISVRGDGALYVEIDNPWAGSTEEGFGQTTAITVSRDAAEDLRDWLNAALAAKTK
jgi:hypothetical protein